MTLADVLAPDRVVLPLQATTLDDAVRELAARLIDVGAVAAPSRLLDRAKEKRAEDIVAMGDRAFLVHYRTDAVRDLVVALGTASHPIGREAGQPDSLHARIVLLILAPPRMAARYLQVLGAFARALSRPAVVEELIAARSPAAIIGSPLLAEIQLPEQLAVRDLMTHGPRTTTPDTPLRDAAVEMVRAGIGALPVVDDTGLVVGILGERELMQHLLASYLQGDPHHRPTPDGRNKRRAVRDAMTRQVICVSPDQPLAEVASLMTNKDVDRVPVVREGKLVGFLTRGEIVRKLIGS